MKKAFGFGIALVLYMLFCISSVYGDDFVVNGNTGFEKISGKMPSGWYQVGILKPEVVFFTDSKVKYRGKHSIAIRVKELTERLKSFGPPNWAQDIVKDIPRGKKIRLTARVMTKDVKGIAPIGVQCWNESRIAAFGTTQYTFPMSGTSRWKEVSLEMEVPKDTVKIRILCMLSGTGTVWFDDVLLVQSEDSAGDRKKKNR